MRTAASRTSRSHVPRERTKTGQGFKAHDQNAGAWGRRPAPAFAHRPGRAGGKERDLEKHTDPLNGADTNAAKMLLPAHTGSKQTAGRKPAPAEGRLAARAAPTAGSPGACHGLTGCLTQASSRGLGRASRRPHDGLTTASIQPQYSLTTELLACCTCSTQAPRGPRGWNKSNASLPRVGRRGGAR